MVRTSAMAAMKAQHYLSGEAIHAGDKIRFGGFPGVVVFVNDAGEYLPGYTAEEWAYFGSGFMIQQEHGALIYQETADEDLEFVARL